MEDIALGDVLGDGAMVTIGKLSEVYAKSTKQLAESSGDLESQMLRIGSAVNQLGQSSTANEAYLVEFLSRMGGIATQANLSADAILGLASALDQDMMKQEMSAIQPSYYLTPKKIEYYFIYLFVIVEKYCKLQKVYSFGFLR